MNLEFIKKGTLVKFTQNLHYFWNGDEEYEEYVFNANDIAMITNRSGVCYIIDNYYWECTNNKSSILQITSEGSSLEGYEWSLLYNGKLYENLFLNENDFVEFIEIIAE